MITNLHIKNIGIIEDLEINLSEGLNALTGETGAGKTLIIDSLEIISGGRFAKEKIRKGENYSLVEVCIYEPESENAIDGNIIVSREIYANGRNLCKINGRMVTVSELKEFMKNIIDIHAQNDSQNLLDSKMHIKYLDNFIGKEIIEIKNKYKEKYVEYIKITKELKENYGDEKEKQRKLDLLKYQVNEINIAKLKVNEETELEEKRKIMLNSEKISTNLNEADISIGENCIDNIEKAIRALEKIEIIDEKYEKTNSNLRNLYYELQEISRDIYSYKDDIYFDESEREEIESRLDLINALKRKYGNTVEEILEYANKTQKEIEIIDNLEEHNNMLKEQLKFVEEDMQNLAIKINKIRTKNAKILNSAINEELKELEMKNAEVNVYVNFNKDDYFENGKDEVEIFVKTNIGEEEHELSKIASGGEMSRIMLAIKSVLADSDEIGVMVFDEIDTGISGKATKAVSEKMKKIAQNHQVLVITHLAVIAASADNNFYISKETLNDKTKTNIRLLKENEVIEEIARISTGEITEMSIKHARELRKNNKTILKKVS